MSLWSPRLIITLLFALDGFTILPAGTASLPLPVSVIQQVIPGQDEEILRQFNVSWEDVWAKQQAGRAAAAAKAQSVLSTTTTTSSPPLPIQHHQQAMRTSAANLMKLSIYEKVMGYVSQNGRPPPSPPAVATATRTLTESENTVTGRVRSIQASCEMPKHWTEESESSTVWPATQTTVHLFFNLSSILQTAIRPGHQLYLISAKLRLFKLSENGETQVTSPSFSSTPSEDRIEDVIPAHLFESSPADDEKIRISVHNYTRGAKRHKVHKKKLLDSQMILAKEEGPLELDVKAAARWWLTAKAGKAGHHNHHQFGLSVEVEDADGLKRPAWNFFRLTNCLTDVQVAQNHPAMFAGPVLELIVAEVPEGRNPQDFSIVIANGHQMDYETSENTNGTPITIRPNGNPHEKVPEEQSDEAVTTTSRPCHQQHKHRHHHQYFNQRGCWPPSPLPTLATLEDRDFFQETEEQEPAQSNTDHIRLNADSSGSLLLQRMMQQQQYSSSTGNKNRSRNSSS